MTLGLCSQIDLDLEVQRASKGQPPAAPADTLLPHRSPNDARQEGGAAAEDEEPELDANAVFAKLSSLKERPRADDEDERCPFRVSAQSLPFPLARGGMASRISIAR